MIGNGVKVVYNLNDLFDLFGYLRLRWWVEMLSLVRRFGNIFKFDLDFLLFFLCIIVRLFCVFFL